MKPAFEPPESPRVIAITNIRATVKALQKRAGVQSLLTAEQEKLARRLIHEADHLSEALQGNPRAEGIAAFDAQQAAIGTGKRLPDAYGRGEFIDEARTVLRAKKERLVAISDECIPLVREARDKLLDEIVEKVAADLDAEGQKQAEEFGIGWFQSSLTAQVIRDLRRRMEKIVPPSGARRNPRTMFEPFIDDCAPIERKDPLVVHQEEKRGFVKRAADAIKQALAEEPDLRAAEIKAANAAKEERKAQMAAEGIIKLGEGK